MKDAILYFIAFVLINLAVSFGAEGLSTVFNINDYVGSTAWLLIMSGATSAIVITLFLVLKWYPASRGYVRSRPWGTFFWTVMLALGTILPLAWLEELIPDELRKDLAGDVIASMLGSTEGYFVICMLAPLAEEIVFRGAIIRRLVEWGRAIRAKRLAATDGTATSALSDRRIEWVAIVVSALLFALAHFNPAQAPHALIVGVLLGWLFVKTGSVVPCFLLHWINNSMAYVAFKLYPSLPMDAKLLDYFHGNSIVMYQALLYSLLIALPALYQLIIMKRRAW